MTYISPAELKSCFAAIEAGQLPEAAQRLCAALERRQIDLSSCLEMTAAELRQGCLCLHWANQQHLTRDMLRRLLTTHV